MDRHQRLARILKELDDRTTLEVDEITDMLSISPATARRDFNYLVKHYNVEKTWGGIAQGKNTEIVDSMLPVQERQTRNITAKKAIAHKAASLVKDGEIIFIDGGTTTLEMVPYLVEKNLKIITNSILIAQRVDTLNKKFISEVFLTGGMLYPNSGLVVGPQAIAAIENFNAHWTFLSTGGITELGATNSNVLVVETEKAMIRQSEKTAILADSSKFRRKDMVKICELNEIDFLISEAGGEEGYLEALDLEKMQTIFA